MPAKANAGDIAGARAAQAAATKADLLERKRPKTVDVAVVLDDEATEEYEAALAALELSANGDRKAAEQRVSAAEDALNEATVVCRFRGVGAATYDEIVDAHPPTAEQIEEAGRRGLPPPAYDERGFNIALVTASLVEPELSEDEVRQMFSTWNAAERMRLVLAALQVNTRAWRVAELGKGSASTRGSSKS